MENFQACVAKGFKMRFSKMGEKLPYLEQAHTDMHRMLGRHCTERNYQE